MLEKINNYKKEINNYDISDAKNLEDFRIKFISKKSIINNLFQEFKLIPNSEKEKIGQEFNSLKIAAKNKLKEASVSINNNLSEKTNNEDLSLPPIKDALGSLHPIRIIKNKIIDIFGNIGFSIEDGPEIEEDWYNFTAINFPKTSSLLINNSFTFSF